MKKAMLLLTCIALAGCKKTDERAGAVLPRQAAPATGEGSSGQRKDIQVDAERKMDPRQERLRAELDKYEDTVIVHDAGELTESERAMLRHLLAASKIVEELHMLQLNPSNIEWRDRVVASGTDLEKRLYARNRMPWCEDDPSPDCRTIEDAPPPPRIGFYHWPDDWKAEEYMRLGREINAAELLSPFTVVRRSESDGYLAVPFAATEALGPRMRKAASLLRRAANEASQASLSKFLMSRADAFESESAFPYDASDYDWIALSGDWDVTVGPYETYRTPHQTKALFEMVVGKEDKALTAELAAFKNNLQEMENSLSLLLGEGIYKSRKLDSRIAIRAIDVWFASGDARRSRGATVAYHLPNRGKAVDDGLYKKVIMVNHAKAFEPVNRARADLVLDESNQASLNHRDSIINTTFHELAHGLGAHHDMSVTTADGKRITVKQALLDNDSLMEELKADSLGLWLSRFQRDKGAIDDAALEGRYVSAVIHLIGLLQYPLEDTYSKMAAVELGWYMDQGAVGWNREQGRLKVVLEKMDGAVESLVRKVATIQLTGDFSQAKSLIDTYIGRTEGGHALKGALADVRETVLEKLKAAGIKSPSLRYEVKGL